MVCGWVGGRQISALYPLVRKSVGVFPLGQWKWLKRPKRQFVEGSIGRAPTIGHFCWSWGWEATTVLRRDWWGDSFAAEVDGLRLDWLAWTDGFVVEMGWNGTGSVRSVISELSRAGNANRKALACGLSAAKPATARVEFRAV
uniref:Uncharacterized protein n=1 Tax=Globodera rostochiensis TaxID=31243 RepID=A0A914GYG2_GLORO